MTLSQLAAVLGLDETDAVRPVPLTDEDIAAGQNRQQRRAGERQRRAVRHSSRKA